MTARRFMWAALAGVLLGVVTVVCERTGVPLWLTFTLVVTLATKWSWIIATADDP